MRISDWSSDVCSSDLEGGEVMKGWKEAMKFHERQVAKHNPREFLTRPAGLKPGSIMENGNIVTRSFGQGSIDSVAFGNIEIAAPVRIRRWKAYLDAGWKLVSWLLDLTKDEEIGRAHV